MSKLVICEKPSVAKSIASALGVTSRADGYFEGGGWLISWCIGHLVGLADGQHGAVGHRDVDVHRIDSHQAGQGAGARWVVFHGMTPRACCRRLVACDSTAS